MDTPGRSNPARAAARRDCQELVFLAQIDNPGRAAQALALRESAIAKGWGDVALLAEYAQLLAHLTAGDLSAVGRSVTDMQVLGNDCGDPASVALASVVRSRFPESAEQADVDLARAIVLLDKHEGGALERHLAHVECAISLRVRRLWEMVVEQYAAADAADPMTAEPLLAALGPGMGAGRWAIDSNRAELLSHMVCLQYLHEDQGTADAALVAEARCREVDTEDVPLVVREELQPFRLLMLGVAGLGFSEAEEQRALAACEPGSVLRGVILLADAFRHRTRHTELALSRVEEAIAILAASTLDVQLELAEFLAVQLEADGFGVETVGLRLARFQQSRRAAERHARLTSMRALLLAERFRLEREALEREARVDELSGIANRRGLHHYREGLAGGTSARLAVLAVDVDRFKDINDRHGHEAGDQAIRRVAAAIDALSRPTDIAVRLGGDEFVLVLADVDAITAERRGEEIVATLGTPDAGVAPLSVSVGVASGRSFELDHLRRQADAALYEAKAAGGGCVVSCDRAVREDLAS